MFDMLFSHLLSQDRLRISTALGKCITQFLVALLLCISLIHLRR